MLNCEIYQLAHKPTVVRGEVLLNWGHGISGVVLFKTWVIDVLFLLCWPVKLSKRNIITSLNTFLLQFCWLMVS